jgi:hypothetical protein
MNSRSTKKHPKDLLRNQEVRAKSLILKEKKIFQKISKKWLTFWIHEAILILTVRAKEEQHTPNKSWQDSKPPGTLAKADTGVQYTPGA